MWNLRCPPLANVWRVLCDIKTRCICQELTSIFFHCPECRCLFCNEVSGACDCPPKTVGANCELCVLGTYGHDPIIGCRDCACDRSGVVGGDISCDAQTGQCQCRPSHQGRRCDECAPGYHGYPQKCQKCDCDARGITGNVCDSQTGKCFCKVSWISI